MRSRVLLAGVLACIAGLLPARAAVASQQYCVGDVATLAAVLTQWNSDSNNDFEIHLQQGTYALPGNNTYDGGGAALQLRGGYTAPNCAGRTLNPANTILDGQNQPGSTISLLAANLTIVEGVAFTRFTGAVRISAYLNTESAPTTTINNCLFTRLQKGLLVVNASGTKIYDNLFYDNSPGTTGDANGPAGALRLSQGQHEGFVLNNTIALNNGNGLSLNTYNGGYIFAGNNVVWGNSVDIVGQPRTQADSAPFVTYSDFATTGGILGTSNNHNINADPDFVSSDLRGPDFRLAFTGSPPVISPAINAGEPGGNYPSADIEGNPRVVGGLIDMGAYESAYDGHDYVVTNPADSGPSTLRQSIIDANNNPGLSHIRFNFSAGCGQIIFLATPLDDIEYPLFIDATTNPGWKANTANGAFDGTLCAYVIPDPGSATRPSRAFHTVAAGSQLNVQGIWFAGFGDAAVRLEGGSGHFLGGNVFTGGGFLPVNHDGVRVTGAAGATTIGGLDAAADNVFDNGTGTAVYLDNAAGNDVVAGNLIGISPDGSTALPNAAGIVVLDSPNATLQANFVGNSSGNGITLSGAGTLGTIVQQNNIGWDYGVPEPNAGAGILITNGAADNVIGAYFFNIAALSVSFGNSIRNSGGPGVWLFGDGGGNTVVANDLVGNGGATFDNGLAIDLAARGPTTLPLHDLDNYPVLLHSFPRPNSQTVVGEFDAAPDTPYRLDFHHLNTAPVGYRGRSDGGLFVAVSSLRTDASGHCSFQLSFPQVQVGGWLSATATSAAASGDTSEMGNAAADETIDDVVFMGGFGPVNGCQ